MKYIYNIIFLKCLNNCILPSLIFMSRSYKLKNKIPISRPIIVVFIFSILANSSIPSFDIYVRPNFYIIKQILLMIKIN